MRGGVNDKVSPRGLAPLPFNDIVVKLRLFP